MKEAPSHCYDGPPDRRSAAFAIRSEPILEIIRNDPKIGYLFRQAQTENWDYTRFLEACVFVLYDDKARYLNEVVRLRQIQPLSFEVPK